MIVQFILLSFVLPKHPVHHPEHFQFAYASNKSKNEGGN